MKLSLKLLASRSVCGPIESKLLLRRCSVVGAHLRLLWSLLSLSRQVTLRALQRANIVALPLHRPVRDVLCC